jgi:N-acetylmuramoyl-L-alanine amidase
MRKIFISAGHSNVKGKDRGAVGNGYIEGELTVELRDLIVKDLISKGVTPIVDDNDSILSHTLAFFKNLTTNSCIVLDIHWNAATPLATGTETLIPAEPSKFEIQLASKLSEVVSKTLNIKKRGNFKGEEGVKSEAQSHHGRLAWMKLTGENVLMEICFITNKTDMELYQTHKQKLAQLIADSLIDAATDFKKPVINTEVEYIVKRGDTLFGISNEFKVPMSVLKQKNNLTNTTIRVGQILKIK